MNKFAIPAVVTLALLFALRVSFSPLFAGVYLLPFLDVAGVSGSRWIGTRQITVTFDRETAFGTSMIFMPKAKYLWPGEEHPMARELRDLVGRRGEVARDRLWPS